MQMQKGMRFIFRDATEYRQTQSMERVGKKVEGNEVRTDEQITVYPPTAEWLRELAEKYDTTVAEIVMVLVEKFYDKLEMEM